MSTFDVRALQQELIETQKELCKRLGFPRKSDATPYGLPVDQAIQCIANRNARNIMGALYVPSIEQPRTAPSIWSQRGDKKQEVNPLPFYHRHWGVYLVEDVLDQRTLRILDKSLLEAIRMHCRHNNHQAQDYLPPPARYRPRSIPDRDANNWPWTLLTQ